MDFKITETGGKVVITMQKGLPIKARKRMSEAGFSAYKANKLFVGLASRRELAEEILGDIDAIEASIHGGTLCSDCKKAVGRCSWSGVAPDGKTLLFQPVTGWKAVKTKISGTCRGSNCMESYRVISCPEFVRG